MSMLSLRGVAYRYGAHPALGPLDLDLEPGQLVGLLGENGSGKTTLIKIVAGLMQDHHGEVLVDGMPLGVATKTSVAYQPDRPSLPQGITVAEAVRTMADFFADFDRNAAAEMLKDFEIDNRRVMKSLSKGQNERVQLALTMARKAKLYLLDEPLSGVDPATRDVILNTIIKNYAPQSLALISTHLVHDIENVIDRAVFLKHGRVVLNGDADELRAQYGRGLESMFKEVYSCLAV